MLGFSFLRTRRPRGFHYRPRYYDARRERLADLEARARQDLGLAPSVAVGDRGERMRAQYRTARQCRGPARRPSVRLVILALLLFAALYFYLKLP